MKYLLTLISTYYWIVYICTTTSVITRNSSCHCVDANRSCECANLDASQPAKNFTTQLCTLKRDTLDTLKLINFTRFQNQSIASVIFTEHCPILLNSLNDLTLYNTDLTRLAPKNFIGLSNLSILNVSNNQFLNSYGDNVFRSIGQHIAKLIAKSNPVRSLTQGVFHGLVKLQSLILSDNKIGYIEIGVFSNNCCGNLRELRLDSNILTVLDAESLVGLNSLEVLDLRNNPIQHLDANVFTPCASTLIELLMSHNDQATFGGFAQPTPNLFTKLNRLLKLEMVELKLTNLTNETFVGLESLRELSLRGNRLIQLPLDLFQATHNLQHLDLADNWLVCLPSSPTPITQSDFLSGLPLRYIDLSWNRLTHLNQLTARSLSLFDNHTIGQTRLVLNFTANPWQQIDDNTFCNPDGNGITRPIDLIIGPLPAIPFVNWHTSLGLWTARAMWPNGPLALIGNLSLIRGLMLDEEHQSNLTPYDQSVIHRGTDKALNTCHTLQPPSATINHSLLVSGYLEASKVKALPTSIIMSSIASYCPRLTIRKLEDWELLKLINYSLIAKIEGMTHSSLSAFEQGSRLYLLVIVGVCVTFLFVALTVIMCYRAWSRKASQKFSNHNVDNCDAILNQAVSAEKPLLLLHSRNSPFDDSEQSYRASKHNENNSPHCNGNINSKSRDNSPNGANSLTELNHKQETLNHINNNNINDKHDDPNKVTVIDRISSRSFNDRPKSDPQAAGLDEVNKLISLGIV